MTKLTDEQKAKRAATRRRNAATKEAFRANEKRLARRLTKVRAFAADTRGNENMRNVAVETGARLAEEFDRLGGLPTVAEMQAVVRKRRERR
jgi:urease accessory protein UreF